MGAGNSKCAVADGCNRFGAYQIEDMFVKPLGTKTTRLPVEIKVIQSKLNGIIENSNYLHARASNALSYKRFTPISEISLMTLAKENALERLQFQVKMSLDDLDDVKKIYRKFSEKCMNKRLHYSYYNELSHCSHRLEFAQKSLENLKGRLLEIELKSMWAAPMA